MIRGPRAVRTVTVDGEPWFVAADVCRALGFSVTKGAVRHLNNLECDEKRLVTRRDTRKIFAGDSAGSKTIISEGGRGQKVPSEFSMVLRAAVA